MAFSYDAASKLFRNGEFLAVSHGAGRTYAERKAQEPRLRSLIANALALIGDLHAAEQLAGLDQHLPTLPAIRSLTESTLCIIQRRLGNHTAALQHAQSAVFLAHQSNDCERAAWAQLHLLRLLIEIGPFDKALTSLVDARRIVAKAGSHDISTYFHICISVMEGQSGRFDEARRHCDIAEGLLRDSSNLWLSASCLINRASIAWFNGEFEEASKLFRLGREIASRIGYEHLTQATDISTAYTQFVTGQFDKAEHTFLAVSRRARTNLATQLSALDGLARTYLAGGRFDEAQTVINEIRTRINQAERAEFTYAVRWPAITEARLLIKKRRYREASALLDKAEERFREQGDSLTTAAVHLTHAQVDARNGNPSQCAARIICASELNIAGIRELQGEYYYGCALTVSDQSLAQQLRTRALRLWKSHGVVSARRELDNAFSLPAVSFGCDARVPLNTVECITNSLAAMSDLAHRPRLLAEELMSVIQALDCSPHVKVVEADQNSQRKPTDRTAVVDLGADGRNHVSVVCEYPDSPTKAILLSDVLRMGRAALELERARQEARNRAAVWPQNTVEEQAGALFVAEEMQTLLATARRIAPTSVPVLITGETGTGKEVLARTIHAYSNRASAAFLPFNCSSVPRDMLDSQLFGHRRGSFTGATDNFPGVIRAAAGGTLFLDEIGETTLEIQPKLLRFLDSNEVHPIGEVQPVKADVRVIAATNVDLDAFVVEGRFREDLFYRLNIVRLHLPPLRERRVEIPILANHYLQKHSQEYRKGDLRLAEETMEYLVLYRWPGNVRQLANEMRRMAVLAETGAVLMPEHLSSDIAASRRTIPASERVLDPTEVVVRLDQPVPAAVRHLEQTMIQFALRVCGGRVEEAAAMLGLSRKGLYLKRLRYGLQPPEGTAAAEVA
jgi:DNA-binding NtrC family response regulator